MSCPWTSALLTLGPLHSDQDLGFWLLWFSGLRLVMNYTASWVCRQQNMGWLSFRNHVTQFLAINLFLYIYTCPIGSGEP